MLSNCASNAPNVETDPTCNPFDLLLHFHVNRPDLLAFVIWLVPDVSRLMPPVVA
jgi:hypothetical protein